MSFRNVGIYPQVHTALPSEDLQRHIHLREIANITRLASPCILLLNKSINNKYRKLQEEDYNWKTILRY